MAILTPHQQEAHDRVIELLKKGEKRIRVEGSAGVGKTVLAGELAKTLIKDRTINERYNNGVVYVTAPTNKALAVLQSKIHCNVAFATIHSALKLQRYINERTGVVTFKKGWSKQDDFKNCKAAMIDEASMLNIAIEGGYVPGENGSKEYVEGYLDSIGFPIIYIGDNKQLNPVGEAESAVFLRDYPIVELTEIIRQGAGNPIIELSRDIDMLFFKIPKLVNGVGYVYDNNKQGIIDSLAEVNGTDEMKYLAYTNEVVDSMNYEVRKRRYGNPKKIEKEETVVFNKPYGVGSFYTNQEVKVLDVDVVTQFFPVPTQKTRYDSEGPIGELDNIRLKCYRINNAFDVIHEDSEDVFNKILGSLKINCSKFGWNWKGKFFFEEQFADIKYNHAITVHKSQGSTYKHAVINIGNIMFNKEAGQRQRMLYTAITRASELDILNNVK